MYLTKTDYIHYLLCPRSLWLLKHKPETYPKKELSQFLVMLAKEGYAVEAYAQMLFPDGVTMPVATEAARKKTHDAFAEKTNTIFQATVQTDDGLFARADIMTRNDDDSYNLYEVKSSGEIKKDAKHNHLKDACFQKIAFERSGLRIKNVSIIHTNKTYRREPEVDPNALLKKVDVTDAVLALYDETETEINNALALLKEDTVAETGCACFRKTRSNHCDAFEYFNGALPKYSVWEIGNLREKKLTTLLDRGVQTIEDIPEDIELNDQQRRQVLSVMRNEPVRDDTTIHELLSALEFPLYFFDYEAAARAVPTIVGIRPWQQVPFQYSLHIMHDDGSLRHRDSINTTYSSPESVLEALCEDLQEHGSVIAWHASYEKTINNDMGATYPAYRERLQRINDRMFDLEIIFKQAYTDADFHGSTSIKKVLPVLCPDVAYDDLAVQDGAQAMEQWFAMVEEPDAAKKEAMRSALLAYCERDTYAMVKLYQTIRTLLEA